MIPLTIDISALVRQFSFTKSEARDMAMLVLDMMVERYESIWNDKVKSELNSTRQAYMRSMNVIRVDDYNVIFELEGKGTGRLAMMIEEGASAFDIKEGFKNSPKAKRKSDGGWFLTVPFRISTPDALAESAVFSGRMTKAIHKIAKEKGSVQYQDLPTEHRTLGMRPEISSQNTLLPKYKREAYSHKSPIFEGIARSTMPQHSHYNTFRRVSDKSEPSSWIHKGFEQRDFMGKSLNELSLEVDEIVNTARREFLDAKFEI